MTDVRVRNFEDFARLLVASGHAGSQADVRQMALSAQSYALHFTHPGRARDDALALFWQVAPWALAGAGTAFPRTIPDRMVAAVKASPLGRDFAAAPLPEAFLRGVVAAMLESQRS